MREAAQWSGPPIAQVNSHFAPRIALFSRHQVTDLTKYILCESFRTQSMNSFLDSLSPAMYSCCIASQCYLFRQFKLCSRSIFQLKVVNLLNS